MADINDPVTEAVDKILFDEAWESAATELLDIKKAKENIDNGNNEQDFLDDLNLSKDDPDFASKIVAASRAWAEALQ